MNETKDISRQRLAEFLAARLRARGKETDESKKPIPLRRPILNTYAEENPPHIRLSE